MKRARTDGRSPMIKQIKVGSIIYNVYEVVELHGKSEINGLPQKLDGEIKHGEGKIYIEKANEFNVRRLTLLHEVLHAIAAHADINMNEKEISLFAFILADVMCQNKELLEMFLPVK